MSKHEIKKSILGSASIRRKKDVATIRKQKVDENLKRYRFGETSHESQNSPYLTEKYLEAILVQLNSIDTYSDGLARLKEYISSGEDRIQSVFNNNALPILGQALLSSNIKDQFNCLWCLANCAASTHIHTIQVAQLIPNVVHLLHSESHEVREQVCWVLGNIAGDCEECRNKVVYTLPSLVDSLCEDISPKSAFKITCAWCISNIMRGETPAQALLSTGKIGEIFNMLDILNLELAVEIAWVIVFLTAKKDSPIDEFVTMGLADRLVRCMSSEHAKGIIGAPLVIAFSNISERLNDEYLGSCVLAALQVCNTQNSHAYSKKESMIFILKLSRERPKLISSILSNTALIETIFQCLSSGAIDVKIVSLLILENLFRNIEIIPSQFTPEIIEELVNLMKERDLEVQFAALNLLKKVVNISHEYLMLCNSVGLIDVLEEEQYREENEFSMAARNFSDYLYSRMEDDDNGLHLEDFSNDEMNTSSAFMQREKNDTIRGVGRGKHLTTPSWMTQP